MNTEYPYLKIKNAEDAKGLFASKDIPADTVLLKIEGKELDFAETVALGEHESYCLQIDNNKYIALHFPFFLANHSCNPNCGVNAALEFVTIAPIKAEEELRWDYSTSMLERSWTMKCDCGEKNCRKEIADFDKLPKDLQRTYVSKGIVMPFILRFLGYQ